MQVGGGGEVIKGLPFGFLVAADCYKVVSVDQA